MSECHTIASYILNGDTWAPDLSFGHWSTAVDTRSLSFVLLPATQTSHNPTVLFPATETSYDPTIYLGILFYENSAGRVSALLQRQDGSGYDPSSIQWIDITSQGSSPLPDAFRNGPGSDNNNSSTLYESDTNATISTAFACKANFSNAAVQLLFYSPNATDHITAIHYNSDISGRYTFTKGMYCAYLNLKNSLLG